MKVQPHEWAGGRVKENHPQHRLFNQILKKQILEIEVESISPEKKYPDADFYKYCSSCMIQWNHTRAPETLRQYASEINKLKTFSPSIRLSTITPQWLNRYKAHCFAFGNAGNTVHKHLKFVRLIIRKAHRERLIEQNPFDIFEMPRYHNPEKKYLTQDKVAAIEKIISDADLPTELRKVATWFCIGCHTGLRFSDVRQFNQKKHIINNRIVLYTQKTGTPVSMPVSNKLKSLFELVNYKWVGISNIHYNRILKHVGTICELGKINAHMSRHTAAIMWANAGISQEVTAKLLGHTDLKSTAIYYKITSTRIDDELKKLETGSTGTLSVAYRDNKVG